MSPVRKLKVDVEVEFYLEMVMEENDTVRTVDEALLEQIKQHLLEAHGIADADEYHVLLDNSDYDKVSETLFRISIRLGLVKENINSPLEDFTVELAQEMLRVLPERITINLTSISEMYYEAVREQIREFGINMDDLTEYYDTNNAWGFDEVLLFHRK